RCRRAHAAANFIANAIDDGLAQIRLKRSLVAPLERLDPLDSAKDGFLDKIVGIHQVAGPPWQTAACPSAQHRKMARKQPVDGVTVACFCALDELEGLIET